MLPEDWIATGRQGPAGRRPAGRHERGHHLVWWNSTGGTGPRSWRSTGPSRRPGTSSIRCTASTRTIRVTDRQAVAPPQGTPVPGASDPGPQFRDGATGRVPAALGGRCPAGRRRRGAPAPVRAGRRRRDPCHARPDERKNPLPAVLLRGQRGQRQAGRVVHRRRSRHGGRAGRRVGRLDHRRRHLPPQSGGRSGRRRGRVPGGGRPTTPRTRFDPARTPRRRRAGTRHPPLHRRGAQRKHPDGQGFHRRRILGETGVRLRGSRSRLRHRAHREVTGGGVFPRAPRRGEVHRAAAVTAVDRGDRRVRRAHQARACRADEPAAQQFRRTGLPGQPGRRCRSKGCGPTRPSPTFPTRSISPS